LQKRKKQGGGNARMNEPDNKTESIWDQHKPVVKN